MLLTASPAPIELRRKFALAARELVLSLEKIKHSSLAPREFFHSPNDFPLQGSVWWRTADISVHRLGS